jgi:hypothetical protein
MLLKLDDIDCSVIRDRVVHRFTVEAMVDATEKAWAQSWAERGSPGSFSPALWVHWQYARKSGFLA